MMINANAVIDAEFFMQRRCSDCSRSMPASMTIEKVRFFIGMRFPNKGVRSTPAAMVSCHVAAINQDSP